MRKRIKVLLPATFLAAGFLALGVQEARAIDVCGNGICASTATPPETCATCPADCGPCPPPPADFANLTDPSDGLPGRIVVSGIWVPFENFSHTNFGQERFVSSNLSIAVDPTNSSRVYIAWADFPGGAPPYTLHVRRSDDRGVNWSASDLITISNATNPALAVNSAGKVAFLYQLNTPVGAALANQRWETHVRRSVNLGATWDDLILANTPAATPAMTFIPYLGDYAYIQAIGKNFYGIFSASNTPDPANFPQGVTYQRSANFTTHQLFRTDGVTPVAVSIDPFFFKLTEP
ncbi:MAG: exo-alpha-sialidase [Acidobacteria bacterium]|nr:exo-alpha-sialidase [Acidobacteriota bacterium]